MPRGADPGPWVEADGPLALCRNGVHACTPDALSRWLDDELWRVELDEVELEREGVLLARRGRLVERIGGWNDGVKLEFADWCLGRARESASAQPGKKVSAMVGYIEELKEASKIDTPMIAFCAAKVAAAVHPEDVQAERRRQSEWLVEYLRLDGKRGPARSLWRRVRRRSSAT